MVAVASRRLRRPESAGKRAWKREGKKSVLEEHRVLLFLFYFFFHSKGTTCREACHFLWPRGVGGVTGWVDGVLLHSHKAADIPQHDQLVPRAEWPVVVVGGAVF